MPVLVTLKHSWCNNFDTLVKKLYCVDLCCCIYSIAHSVACVFFSCLSNHLFVYSFSHSLFFFSLRFYFIVFALSSWSKRNLISNDVLYLKIPIHILLVILDD